VPADREYSVGFHTFLLNQYLQKTPWTRLRLSNLHRLVRPRKGATIIDLGCSGGAVTHWCATQGMHVTGVDLSKNAIELAEKTFRRWKFPGTITFLQRDVVDLHGFEDGLLDKAVSADVIEHLPQEVWEGMCREVFRVLKPDGTFSIYTPNPSHVIELLKKRNVLLKENTSHIGLRTMEEVTRTMEEAGFAIDLAYYSRSHITGWNRLEVALMRVPLLRPLFGYRICVRARVSEGSEQKEQRVSG